MASPLSVLMLCLSGLFSFITARKGHLAPLGQSGMITRLPYEFEGYPDPVYFLKEHVHQNKPLVMRGAALDMPATKLWTDEYMQRKTAKSTQMFLVEHGKKETRKSGTKMTFEEYLRKYNNSDIYLIDEVPKELIEDFIRPWPLQCEEYDRSFETKILSFSSGGTKSVIDNNGFENIICLIRGRKKFLFVNATKYQDIESKILDIDEGGYGSVDVEKVDLDKYPFYDGMEFFSVDISAGDCLYVPIYWIRQVDSLGSNIAVHILWDDKINAMVKEENCNKEYNRNMNFATVKFHHLFATFKKMSLNETHTHHVLRHGISRFVFTMAKLQSINSEQFSQIMLQKKKCEATISDLLLDIFNALDANKNKRLDLADLQLELHSYQKAQLLYAWHEWIDFAPIYGFAMPVDFYVDTYETMKPFLWSEVTGEKAADEPSEGDTVAKMKIMKSEEL